jgi:negative regulator of sigma E activity
MTPEQWDRSIEEAARDLTTARPAPDFRARVMNRVSTTEQASAPIVPVWAWRGAAMLAAAAVIAIALGSVRPYRGSVSMTDLAKAGSAPATPTIVPGQPETTSVAVLAPRRAQPARAPEPPAGLQEWRTRNIPGLIQPAGLSISQLSVTPLGIAPIVVAPIDDER